jgi:hypothetical protein
MGDTKREFKTKIGGGIDVRISILLVFKNVFYTPSSFSFAIAI